jgi:hypothetical protein
MCDKATGLPLRSKPDLRRGRSPPNPMALAAALRSSPVADALPAATDSAVRSPKGAEWVSLGQRPRTRAPSDVGALKGRNSSPVMAPLQGSGTFEGRIPRALPWAFALRPVGAPNSRPPRRRARRGCPETRAEKQVAFGTPPAASADPSEPCGWRSPQFRLSTVKKSSLSDPNTSSTNTSQSRPASPTDGGPNTVTLTDPFTVPLVTSAAVML